MKKTALLVFIILVISIGTHFAFFGHPNSTVFDEVHFGKFISGYLNHKYFFDIHPPLGKLAIAGVAKITGYQTGFDFKEIAKTYPNNSYIWLRLLPVLAGTLLPLVIFFLARNLKFSTAASFAAALFIIFENAILGQSLFILLDSMLLLFGFLGLLLYLIARKLWIRPHTKNFGVGVYLLAFISLSFSLSIKWTGLAFLGLVIIIEAADFIKHRVNLSPIPNFWPRILIIIFLPVTIYFAIFCLHFAILNKSGDGDAFHSKEFQKTLSGNSYQSDPSVKPENMLLKFIELNFEMYRSNGRITDKHPYASKWYTWPMMARPIYYWNQTLEDQEARIYLFGNPIIFWASTLGLVVLLLDCLFFAKELRKHFKTIMFILVGFILNFLPFVFIKRPMFLYHYLAALIFAILALCFVIDLSKNYRRKIIIFALILTFAIASFLFFSPLTYGLKLPAKSFQLRLWTNNWQ